MRQMAAGMFSFLKQLLSSATPAFSVELPASTNPKL